MKKNVITFCRNRNCCPVVIIENDSIILGDENGPEGITKWTKEQFKDFIKAAKDGDFDSIIKEKGN
jgi:BRCT domain type II-containing protein